MAQSYRYGYKLVIMLLFWPARTLEKSRDVEYLQLYFIVALNASGVIMNDEVIPVTSRFSDTYQ